MQNFPFFLDCFFRILIAALCGAAIGYERATLRKSAGIRTHIVVAVASALFMIVSKYGFFDILKDTGIGLDPSRIAAQIVTGISFIGAGTILVRKAQVSGLTTAAGVWATAAIGTAVGAGMYTLGIISTCFLFIVQIVFHDDTFINFLIVHVRFNVQIEVDNVPNILNELKQILANNDVEQVSLKLINASKDRLLINVDGIIKSRKDENDIIITLEKNNYIHRVSCARG